MSDVRYSGGVGMINAVLATIPTGSYALVTLPQNAIGAMVQLFDDSGNLLDPNSGVAIGAAATVVANTGDDPAPEIYRGPGSAGPFPEEAGTLKIFVTTSGAFDGTNGIVRSEWKRTGMTTYATVSSGIKPIGKVGAYQAWVFLASTAIGSVTLLTAGDNYTALITVDGAALPVITVVGASAATIASVIQLVNAGLSGASCFFSTTMNGTNGGIVVRSNNATTATSSIAISGTLFADITNISAGPTAKIPRSAGTLIDLGNNLQGLFDDGVDDTCNAGDTWVYEVSPVAIQVKYSAGTYVPYTATMAAATSAIKEPPYVKVTNNSGFDFKGSVVAMVVT